MTFSDLIKTVDALSRDEMRRLREYIEQKEASQIQVGIMNIDAIAEELDEDLMSSAGTLNMDELNVALESIREGLSTEEFAEIEKAMNSKYIEPLDDIV